MLNKSVETNDIHNKEKSGGSGEGISSGNIGGSGDSNNDLKPSKMLSKKTYSNKKYRILKVAGGSSNSKSATMKEVLKCLPIENQKDIRNDIDENVSESMMVDICGELLGNFRVITNSKSTDEILKVAQAMSPLLQKANVRKSSVRTKLNFGWEATNKIMALQEGEILQRKKKDGKYTDEDIERIKDFYTEDDISRPNNKQKSKKLQETIRYMSMTIGDAHVEYNTRYPHAKVHFWFFHRHRPKHIKPLYMTPSNECQCVYCTNVTLKLEILRILGLKIEMDLYKKLICEKTSDFREIDCILHKCKKCSDWGKTINSLACNLDMDKIVFWKRWEYVNVTQKSGKEVPKRLSNTRRGTIRECLDELIQKDILKPQRNVEVTFVRHFFTQSYQFQKYKECLRTLRPGHCLIIQDFAQNIEIRYYLEIKAKNWSKKQISLHVQVLLYMTSESEEIHELQIAHLSDYTKHDAPMVHHVSTDAIDIVSKKHPEENFVKFYIWSDGCTGQYKGKSSFYFLDQYESRVERNFFGSEHGKNRCDAVTGKIAIAYKNAVKSNVTDINNANELKDFLSEKFKDDHRMIFKVIEENDSTLEKLKEMFANVEIDVLSGNSTRILHEIKPSGEKGYFLTRNFSCFCACCLDEDFNNCEYKDYTGGEFKKKVLKSNDGTTSYPINDCVNEDWSVDEDDNVQYNNVKDKIIVEKQELQFTDLEVGNVIVVPVNDKQKTIYYFPAEITRLFSDETVNIDYLKTDFDNKKILRRVDSESEKNWNISFVDITMKLPKPKYHRGTFTFEKELFL